MLCGYKIELLNSGIVLECIMDAHPGTSLHSTETQEFRKTPSGQWVIRDFDNGFRRTTDAIEVL